eukprot:3919725-Prymnesium_polylepis.1
MSCDGGCRGSCPHTAESGQTRFISARAHVCISLFSISCLAHIHGCTCFKSWQVRNSTDSATLALNRLRVRLSPCLSVTVVVSTLAA